MSLLEQIIFHSRCLPAEKQQEILDFIQFLEHQQLKSLQRLETKSPLNQSIQDHPAFGMWIDLKGSSREWLNQLRQQQWI